jgi:hypothetical protein
MVRLWWRQIGRWRFCLFGHQRWCFNVTFMAKCHKSAPNCKCRLLLYAICHYRRYYMVGTEMVDWLLKLTIQGTPVRRMQAVRIWQAVVERGILAHGNQAGLIIPKAEINRSALIDMQCPSTDQYSRVTQDPNGSIKNQ